MNRKPLNPNPAPEPPVAKCRLTLTITGNSHDEIESELLSMVRGGYLLDSDGYKRDEFTVYGGRRTAKLEHANPDMTPERYDTELDEWCLLGRKGSTTTGGDAR